jgi:hypothetical protein
MTNNRTKLSGYFVESLMNSGRLNAVGQRLSGIPDALDFTGHTVKAEDTVGGKQESLSLSHVHVLQHNHPKGALVKNCSHNTHDTHQSDQVGRRLPITE